MDSLNGQGFDSVKEKVHFSSSTSFKVRGRVTF